MTRRRLLATTAALILTGAITGVVLAQQSSREEATLKPPPATAPVVKTTLQATKTVSGTLGYGDPVPIDAGDAATSGTLTWLAPVGSTVQRGSPLFKVDERPVVLLYGTLPVYRTLAPGMKGADVLELEQNLAALGYPGVTVDNTYTPATANAVRSWQRALGLSVTGTVEPGQIMFEPGAVRIAEHAALLGDTIGAGSRVLTVTGTDKLVTLDVDIAERALAVTGQTVTVTVPGVGAVKGTIFGTGTVAQPKDQQAGAAPAANNAPASGATVQVTVVIADQQALASLDAAPVTVDLVSDERKDVLAVPITALLALPGGGYGVEVVERKSTRVVPVKIGIFAGGEVEISGTGIAAGVMVGIAK